MVDAAVAEHISRHALLAEDSPRSRFVVKRNILARHALFSALCPADIDRLAGYARLERYARNQCIFSKGDPGSGLMAVVAGAVRISTPSADGKEIVLNVIQPGEVFGEIALLDGRDRTANAVASQECDILSLERREFVPFLRQNPDAALMLLTVLCERLRRTSEHVEDVVFHDPGSRLAKTILRLGQPIGGGRLRLRATQKEIGQMIGLSRESTNKQLQVWVRKGWVVIEKGGLVVLDAGALEI